jgi:hypothetical protein
VSAKKLVLIVIDGLTPAMLEAATARGSAPSLAFLLEHGTYRTATSVFPSLTPVCLTSIATGAFPDVHGIPHLVWWNRDEGRLVEYGSSFAAIRRAGMLRSVRDSVIAMSGEHLRKEAVTVFEALEDAGLVPAAVNITCYRGRTSHAPRVPWLRDSVMGPKRFFFFNLYESDRTGAGIAARARSLGSIDAYAAAVGRWLVTRDGFDFLVYYLPDYDFASHVAGPDAAHDALARSDAAVAALVDAAGGRDAFLERYAVILCSDHGQTRIEHSARLQDALDALPGVLVTASNRAGMAYLRGGSEQAAELAARLDGEPSVGVALYRDGADAVARRDGEELRFAPDGPSWRTSGDASILDQPDALRRAWHALGNPNAGELLVSAATGYEFADLGGSHHAGGGSHGSLEAGDSLVPMVTVGLAADIASITDVMPTVLEHFGVEAPPYARAVARAA